MDCGDEPSERTDRAECWTAVCEHVAKGSQFFKFRRVEERDAELWCLLDAVQWSDCIEARHFHTACYRTEGRRAYQGNGKYPYSCLLRMLKKTFKIYLWETICEGFWLARKQFMLARKQSIGEIKYCQKRSTGELRHYQTVCGHE